MKPPFQTNPNVWLRASRTYATPADSACAVEQFVKRGHSAAAYVSAVVLAVLCVLLLAGVM